MEPLHGSELYQLGWQDRTKALEQQAIGRKGAGFNKVIGPTRSWARRLDRALTPTHGSTLALARL